MRPSTPLPCSPGLRNMAAPSSTASVPFSSKSPRLRNTRVSARFGIETPATIATIGREHIPQAASAIGYPIILKHNRAGKGLGVKLIYSEAALEEHLASEAFEDSVDGIMLVQRYIKGPAPFITRVEFIGGKLLYAVRVDTSQGFELCPADACQIEAPSEACPAVAPGDKFQILSRFEHPLIPDWQSFLAANNIGVAGIEFIEDAQGRPYTYDVNTNTNYNPDAETRDGRRGMQAIALHLKRLLLQQYGSATGSPRQPDKPLAGQARPPSSDVSDRSRFNRAAASWLHRNCGLA